MGHFQLFWRIMKMFFFLKREKECTRGKISVKHYRGIHQRKITIKSVKYCRHFFAMDFHWLTFHLETLTSIIVCNIAFVVSQNLLKIYYESRGKRSFNWSVQEPQKYIFLFSCNLSKINVCIKKQSVLVIWACEFLLFSGNFITVLNWLYLRREKYAFVVYGQSNWSSFFLISQ